MSKKPFNVESPSFTPSGQHGGPPKKSSTLSSQAANAAPFTPRGTSHSAATVKHNSDSLFNPASIREFTPHNYDVGNNATPNAPATQESSGMYPDPFTMNPVGAALPQTSQFNPYANDHGGIAGPGAQYYSAAAQFGSRAQQPPNYHLYQPFDSYRGDLQPWQRSTYDFFMPAKMREEIQQKMHATLQTVSPSHQVDNWHSLCPLYKKKDKNTKSFHYPSWVYKAMNSRLGRHYALRRLEGYRLTNEKAILNVMKEWKKIKNANIVTVHEAFTTRAWNDSSLIFVFDFHPLSRTLQEHHFPSSSASHNNGRTRGGTPVIPENVLWSYMCQIANALKAIHSNNLAARCLELSKILVTDHHRIRLAACSILDVVQFDSPRPIQELQEEDLTKFGTVMLSLASGTTPAHMVNNNSATLAHLATKYSPNLKEAIEWLLSPATSPTKTIDGFLNGIALQMTNNFDLALQDGDEKYSQLAREVENGRVARLMMKLAQINERGDLGGQPNWSETGERYQLKLFRDYVFHAVDADGKPNLSIGHMLLCMSKLDAGIDEKIVLTSAENETVFIISYKELKQCFERSYNELLKFSKNGLPGPGN
ncbi:hypothetical protein QBC35DRAFT_450707 [Podospora australis]|uniref:PAN2-PAN3 deadenylation complex subunit PAN3 n=1 Tax=Podospora australis TaxID=1536484 RepID=A0AAN7AIZ7_9PEZI|nr:hypothetical protein QBC35DRAFT_450707 [Podospora australis]